MLAPGPIEDCLLLNKILDLKQVILPKIVMKHLEHARFMQKHGIPYGFLIRKILEYFEIYTKGTNPVVLEKPLDLKCLSQAPFMFDKKDKKWHKASKVYCALEKADEEHVLLLEGPGLDPKIDKVLQKMVEMIKTLAHQVNEHYLDLSKRLKKVEDKVITRTKEVIAKEV